MISIWIIFCLKWSENFFFQYWNFHLTKVFPTSLEISGCLNNCINIHKVRMFLLRELVVLFSLSVWVSQCCEQKRDHCRQCDDKSKCKVCEDGYFLTPNDQTCQKCPLGCSQCLFGSESVECFSCLPTFKLSHSECICEERHGISHHTQRCELCLDPRCHNCAHNFEICVSCFNNFGVDEGICRLCEDHNCELCGEDYRKCEKCDDGFGKNSKQNFNKNLNHISFSTVLCVLCKDSQCVRCP